MSTGRARLDVSRLLFPAWPCAPRTPGSPGELHKPRAPALEAFLENQPSGWCRPGLGPSCQHLCLPLESTPCRSGPDVCEPGTWPPAVRAGAARLHRRACPPVPCRGLEDKASALEVVPAACHQDATGCAGHMGSEGGQHFICGHPSGGQLMGFHSVAFLALAYLGASPP